MINITDEKEEEEKIPIWINSGTMKIPQDPKKPLIMVGHVDSKSEFELRIGSKQTADRKLVKKEKHHDDDEEEEHVDSKSEFELRTGSKQTADRKLVKKDKHHDTYDDEQDVNNDNEQNSKQQNEKIHKRSPSASEDDEETHISKLKSPKKNAIS